MPFSCAMFIRSGLFFFNDTATTEIYTLSLHDALPISSPWPTTSCEIRPPYFRWRSGCSRSEEHTSELQSQSNLVCRLLLEKKRWRPKKPSSLKTPSKASARENDPQSRCNHRGRLAVSI